MINKETNGFKLFKNIFKKDSPTISLVDLTKDLNIKNNRYEIHEANYSKDDFNHHKELVWIILFGKHEKNVNVFNNYNSLVENNNYWNYAIMINKDMEIVDIYEDYYVNYRGSINGVKNTNFNGKKLIDSSIENMVIRRNKVHESSKERMRVMTPNIGYSRYN